MKNDGLIEFFWKDLGRLRIRMSRKAIAIRFFPSTLAILKGLIIVERREREEKQAEEGKHINPE